MSMRAARCVMFGAEKAVLIRVVEREVRFAIRGVIHAIDDKLTGFVRFHG